jgi:hypothetical protein
MHTCHCVPHGKGLRKLILRAHRQAWCWQDEYQNMTLADIRRLEDEAQEELNTRMAAHSTNSQTVTSSNKSRRKKSITTDTTNERRSSFVFKRLRKPSIHSINSSRLKISTFPVPPLTNSDETVDEEFFDAHCKPVDRHVNNFLGRPNNDDIESLDVFDFSNENYLFDDEDSVEDAISNKSVRLEYSVLSRLSQKTRPKLRELNDSHTSGNQETHDNSLVRHIRRQLETTCYFLSRLLIEKEKFTIR